MAARLNPRHQQFVRDKIQSSQIINRLQNHIDGSVELSSTQVRAAEILLNKCVPNLQSTEVKATVTYEDARELSDAILANIATASGAGVTGPESGEVESPSVH